MKTNRKTRPQPSLASLTTDEYHQLAEMVCTRTYEDVRQQVNKPRSDGGFDLNISIKPLQVLHARVQRLNKINQQLATGEKLTLTAYDEIHAGEKRAPEEVQDAIMSATYILVTGHDNTPHQLLALQRLADFPARAEYREQTAQIRAQSAQDLSRLRNQSLAHRTERMQITRAREHRAQAKEKRAAELHTLKLQLALLSIKNHGGTSSTSSQSKTWWGEAPVEPTSTSRDVITDTDAASADTTAQQENPVHLVNPVETQNSKLKTQNSNTASSFLSPAVLANNNLYNQKIASGEIRRIFTPGKHYEIEYCNPADQPALERLHTSGTVRFIEDPTRTQWLPALRTFGPNPYIPPTHSTNEATSRTQSGEFSSSTEPGLNGLNDRFIGNSVGPGSVDGC